MKTNTSTRKIILSKKAELIKLLKEAGWTGQDIGEMFSIDKSTISRILNDEDAYKKWVKKYLKRL